MEYYTLWIALGGFVGMLMAWVSPRAWFAGSFNDLFIGAGGGWLGGWVSHLILGSMYGAWVGGAFAAVIGALVTLNMQRMLFRKPALNRL